MNEQLPPIDSELRRQLARRAAGRRPDGLLDEVSATLDRTREPRAAAAAGWTRPTWRLPRVAAAGAAVAVVVVLAAAIVLPAWRNGPAASPGGGLAGYPAGRGLTTAELAALLAGPQLPTNETLVVSATIDIRSDVCPMNRYPTLGVIDGMDPQVCVMEGTLPPVLNGRTATGAFALRYLGERTFGLLGQVTPASSGLAFRATDDWPLEGKTFLVDGWLGATITPLPCASTDPSSYGDPLDPGGTECGYDYWLSDTSSPPAAVSRVAVEAAGAAHFDSIGVVPPTQGLYVVRSITDQCPNSSPQNNRGCSAWRVLARVADVSLPQPSLSAPSSSFSAWPSAAVPTPTSLPPATPVTQPSDPLAHAPLAAAPIGMVGSGGRPLTEAEFTTLLAADPTHLAGRIAIVKGSVPTGFECSDIGTVASGAPAPAPGCRVLEGQIAREGYWAVRVGADGKLSVVGEIALNKTGLVFTLDQVAWPALGNGGKLAVVDAWLDWEPSLACDTPPYPSDSECGAGAVWSVLTSAPLETQGTGYPYMAPPPSGVVALDLGLGAYQIYGSRDLEARPIHALFLVRMAGSGGTILARLEVSTP
jgi:hypothetical protein